jgi:hydrogenase nickel incorporation protein HypA/HybF
MHETSLVMSMMNAINEIAKREKAKRVMKVKVRIGKMSGVVIDSFQFAFEALKSENPLTEIAELVIEECPLIYECQDCGNRFESDNIYFPECPECGSLTLKTVSGEELEISNVELEV